MEKGPAPWKKERVCLDKRLRGFPLGELFLALAAFIWGTAFVAQSVGMEHLGPCAFNAARSLIGGVALLPAALISLRRDRVREQTACPGEKHSFWDRYGPLGKNGLLCGLLLGVASLLQQTGLQTVSSGKAGFLTALYIVLVPVLGCFFGKRPGGRIWAAVLLALVGAWFLSVGEEGFSIAPGDLLVLASSLFFSFHILAVEHASPYSNGIALSCIQFFVAGLFSLILTLFLETPQWGDLLRSWGPLLYTGVLSSGVAYTFQILGQKTTKATVASLILSLESVFAALAGWAVLGDVLLPREIFGCVLVFGAVILAQLPGKNSTPGTTGEASPVDRV